MAYAGTQVKIPLGRLGVVRDLSHEKIPPGALWDARNVDINNGAIVKSPGSEKWNQTVLGAGVLAFHEYQATAVAKRVLALLSDGTVHKFLDKFNSSEVTPASASDPTTLTIGGQVHILSAGQESTASPDRKMFVFSGNNAVQVIVGDGTTRRNLQNPPVDWSGSNQPNFGILHRNRVFAFGNRNFPHVCYTSLDTDHEDFLSSGSLVNFVFPGKGERLNGGFIFKDNLYLTKYPTGIYKLVDSDADPDNWFFVEANDAFGLASGHAAVAALDDIFFMTASGSIVNLSLAETSDDTNAADILKQMKAESWIREELSIKGIPSTWAAYYEEKKKIYFTFQSGGANKNDRLLLLDFSGDNPKLSQITKDQPTCLGLLSDVTGKRFPAYGNADGWIASLDSPNRRVALTSNTAYEGMFWTISTDFNDPNEKHWDFLEVKYEPTGRWNLSVDVYVDGILKQSGVTFDLSYGAVLDDFILDDDRLSDRFPRTRRRKLNCGRGRNISFRCTNSGDLQNFKIVEFIVHFRQSGQREKGRRE